MAAAPPDDRRLEPGLRYLLVTAMTAVGVLHFATPQPFVELMPRVFPEGVRLPLVLVSGVCEIGLGLGLLPTATRRAAAFGLMALYVAVFPANIRMALDPDAFHVPAAVAYGRLPFQLLFLAWAYRYTRRPATAPATTSEGA
ncbi:MAG TPA: hypothetical protein PK141_02135 [Polyangiaceae bacterium]|jgi:uncharacterized membrane protein|nr:hypothetical protein [Polyangiaceae bacterium]